MFFIFGWGKTTVSEKGRTPEHYCEQCRNQTKFLLAERRTWFTLFFIPVIPYEHERLVLCPICSSGYVLNESQFRTAVSGQRISFLPARPPTLKSDGMLPGHRRVGCPACKSYFEVPEGSSGEVNCPTCASLVSYSTPGKSRDSLRIPESEPIPPQKQAVQCPNTQCGTRIEVLSDFDGTTRCPECGASFNHALVESSWKKQLLAGRASWKCRCGHFNEAATETCAKCQRAPNAII